MISKQCLDCKTVTNSVDFSDEFIVKEAAKVLRKMVIAKMEASKDLPWPPTVESLQRKDRDSPELLQTFYGTLLNFKSNHHETNAKNTRLIQSFCSDIMFALSKGKFITLKHAALGLGLHSITGMKVPILFLNKIGHSISYDQINLIETAQAELVQQFHSLSLELPLHPASEENKV